MFRIETNNPPRTKLVKEQAYGPGSVRIYQGNSENVALQMWCPNGRYTLVMLTSSEARAIAEALQTEADNFLTPLDPKELTKIIDESV